MSLFTFTVFTILTGVLVYIWFKILSRFD
ncbi:hypothetical protein SCFA_630008 [anaerobic digester metagenome]|uniref:Uncharacterized protein n=1 Tax=anaerobic digester metagenome TaxID=1263854 RepID=A0A485MD39_9ZZZZ